jgi:hypothetical protein
VQLDDCQASFTNLGEELMVSLETFFCGYSIQLGSYVLFHGQAFSFGNTVWVVFLDEYPWRTQVAYHPEVELLHSEMGKS